MIRTCGRIIPITDNKQNKTNNILPESIRYDSNLKDLAIVNGLWFCVCLGILSVRHPIVLWLVAISLWSGGITAPWDVSSKILYYACLGYVQRQTCRAHRRWYRVLYHTYVCATKTDTNQTSMTTIPYAHKMENYILS